MGITISPMVYTFSICNIHWGISLVYIYVPDSDRELCQQRFKMFLLGIG
jgi:hypothetical protein